MRVRKAVDIYSYAAPRQNLLPIEPLARVHVSYDGCKINLELFVEGDNR